MGAELLSLIPRQDAPVGEPGSNTGVEDQGDRRGQLIATVGSEGPALLKTDLTVLPCKQVQRHRTGSYAAWTHAKLGIGLAGKRIWTSRKAEQKPKSHSFRG